MTSLHGPRRVFSAQVDQRYHCDGVGRIDRAAAFNGRQRTFTFDNLGRLAQTAHGSDTTCYVQSEDSGYFCEQVTLDSTHTYSYDQVGNRTDLGGTYNTGNRIWQFNGCSYWSDYDGNVTTRACPGQTITFTWSAENRLTSYSVSGGATVTMDYDAGGRLTRRASTSAGTTYMLWDGANLVSELDATGAKMTEYSYYGLDRLHTMTIGTTYYQAHQDAQGNVLALTDQNRNLARTYNYEDFGRAAVGGIDYAGLANRDRARWKGALWMGPEVELYYMRNRWYEPQTGRFLSEDPLGLGGGINPYAFAGADPVQGSDPLGLECRPVPGKNSCELDTLRVTPGAILEYPGPGALVGNQYNGWQNGTGSSDGSLAAAAGHGSGTPEQDSGPSCGQAIAIAGATGLLDALTVTGVFTAFAFEGKAALHAAHAGSLAVRGLWGGLARGAVGHFEYQGSIIAAGAVESEYRAIARGAAITAGQSAGVNTLTESGVSWWRVAADFVPVVATGFAIADAVAACHE